MIGFLNYQPQLVSRIPSTNSITPTYTISSAPGRSMAFTSCNFPRIRRLTDVSASFECQRVDGQNYGERRICIAQTLWFPITTWIHIYPISIPKASSCLRQIQANIIQKSKYPICAILFVCMYKFIPNVVHLIYLVYIGNSKYSTVSSRWTRGMSFRKTTWILWPFFWSHSASRTCGDQYRSFEVVLKSKHVKVYHFSLLCIGSFWITKEKLWKVPMVCGQQARWFDDMYILPVRKMFPCSPAIASLEVRYKGLSIVICEPGILLPCYRTSMTRFCQQACCADTQQQHSLEDPVDSSLIGGLVIIHALWSNH